MKFFEKIFGKKQSQYPSNSQSSESKSLIPDNKPVKVINFDTYEQAINRLANLLSEAMVWGNFGHKGVDWRQYPQSEEVKGIGEYIYGRWGMSVMQSTWGAMRSLEPLYGNMLNWCWAEIGGWQA